TAARSPRRPARFTPHAPSTSRGYASSRASSRSACAAWIALPSALVMSKAYRGELYRERGPSLGLGRAPSLSRRPNVRDRELDLVALGGPPSSGLLGDDETGASRGRRRWSLAGPFVNTVAGRSRRARAGPLTRISRASARGS